MSFLSLRDKIIDTVVFDFDGTLAKLNIDFNQMRRVIDGLILRYGVDDQPLQNVHVLEKILEVQTILQNTSQSKARNFLAEAFLQIESIEMEAARRGELFEHTRPLLNELRQSGIRTGIITRNCAKAVYNVFPDILDYCPAVVCRDDVKQVKPHPEHIGKVLQVLGSDARTSLMVGDHPLDIETGRNAGTSTAGVLSGHFKENDFLKAGADSVLPRAADVLTLLKRTHDHPIFI